MIEEYGGKRGGLGDVIYKIKYKLSPFDNYDRISSRARD